MKSAGTLLGTLVVLVASSCAQPAIGGWERSTPGGTSAFRDEFVIEQERYERDVLTTEEEALTDAAADDLSPVPDPPPVIDSETDDSWT